MINYCEVVKTVDLHPIKILNGDDLRFRIEILNDLTTGNFSANLWRIENYRIQPTFPQKEGVPGSDLADEEILVKDTFILEGMNSKDADSALQLALKTIAEKFA
jgi:hypothetical protein